MTGKALCNCRYFASVTSDGYVAQSGSASFGSNTISSTYMGMVIAGIDTTGNWQWAEVADGSFNDEGYAIATMPSGSIVSMGDHVEAVLLPVDKPVRLPLVQVVKVPMGTTSLTLTQMGIGTLSILVSIFGQFKLTVMGMVLATLMTTVRGSQCRPVRHRWRQHGMSVMMTSMATENSTKTTIVTALRPIGIRPMSALTWTKTVVSMLQRMQMMTTMVSIDANDPCTGTMFKQQWSQFGQ